MLKSGLPLLLQRGKIWENFCAWMKCLLRRLRDFCSAASDPAEVKQLYFMPKLKVPGAKAAQSAMNTRSGGGIVTEPPAVHKSNVYRRSSKTAAMSWVSQSGSGRLQSAAWPGVLLRRCRGTRSAWGLRLHSGPQNAIDARLIALAVGLEPIQHVRVKTDGELVFSRGTCFRCLRKKLVAKRWNVRIVNGRSI